jgi:CDP-paratose 2-epimerase
MSVAVVTGSAGLVGSEAARHFAAQGMLVVGIDNDMRRRLFGAGASTRWQVESLTRDLGRAYLHVDADIRDAAVISRIFRRYQRDITLVIHAAAQPSHDWAAGRPQVDFAINAQGTLNLLEATRQRAPHAVFIFTSTNKVYGDSPNRLPLVERATRWEIEPGHPYENGILEDLSIDQTQHSLFGASKVAADVLVQEYGRYYGLPTVCFRAGCLTGPNHSGSEQHGFLSYLMKCVITGAPYTVFGYRGKQVRDNIHSADLIQAFDRVFRAPRAGEVYNIGGGRGSNCSVLEAIGICEEIAERRLRWTYSNDNRRGDHIWWISGLSKFSAHYPGWRVTRNVPEICREIYDAGAERWLTAAAGTTCA